MKKIMFILIVSLPVLIFAKDRSVYGANLNISF